MFKKNVHEQSLSSNQYFCLRNKWYLLYDSSVEIGKHFLKEHVSNFD